MDKIRAWKAGDDEKQAEVAEVRAWFRKLRDMAEAVNIQKEKCRGSWMLLPESPRALAVCPCRREMGTRFWMPCAGWMEKVKSCPG